MTLAAARKDLTHSATAWQPFLGVGLLYTLASDSDGEPVSALVKVRLSFN